MSKADPLFGADGLDDILRFYEERGYAHKLGLGEAPALIVVDFSRAFTGGRSAFPGGDFTAELRQTRRLLASFRGAFPVLFTTIAYRPDLADAGLWARKVPWLSTCLEGSPLVEIDPSLAMQPGETLIVKKYPSAFFETDLEASLHAQDIDTIVLAGCTTSVCVRATALDAMQRGFRPIVAAEAVGDFNRNLHAVHLRDLHARYADVMSVDEVIAHIDGLKAKRRTSLPARE